METYTFTLILSGVNKLTQEIEDKLFEAGCDDALLGVVGGVGLLDFDREAPSFFEAVSSAIKAVESAGHRVVRVTPDELVTASEIAKRTGRTRESVRLLAAGKRGPGHFPAPLSGVSGQTRLWRWSDVVAWMVSSGLSDGKEQEKAELVAAINGALQLRQHAPRDSKAILGVLEL